MRTFLHYTLPAVMKMEVALVGFAELFFTFPTRLSMNWRSFSILCYRSSRSLVCLDELSYNGTI